MVRDINFPFAVHKRMSLKQLEYTIYVLVKRHNQDGCTDSQVSKPIWWPTNIPFSHPLKRDSDLKVSDLKDRSVDIIKSYYKYFGDTMWFRKTISNISFLKMQSYSDFTQVRLPKIKFTSSESKYKRNNKQMIKYDQKLSVKESELKQMITSPSIHLYDIVRYGSYTNKENFMMKLNLMKHDDFKIKLIKYRNKLRSTIGFQPELKKLSEKFYFRNGEATKRNSFADHSEMIEQLSSETRNTLNLARANCDSNSESYISSLSRKRNSSPSPNEKNTSHLSPSSKDAKKLKRVSISSSLEEKDKDLPQPKQIKLNEISFDLEKIEKKLLKKEKNRRKQIKNKTNDLESSQVKQNKKDDTTNKPKKIKESSEVLEKKKIEKKRARKQFNIDNKLKIKKGNKSILNLVQYRDKFKKDSLPKKKKELPILSNGNYFSRKTDEQLSPRSEDSSKENCNISKIKIKTSPIENLKPGKKKAPLKNINPASPKVDLKKKVKISPKKIKGIKTLSSPLNQKRIKDYFSPKNKLLNNPGLLAIEIPKVNEFCKPCYVQLNSPEINEISPLENSLSTIDNINKNNETSSNSEGILMTSINLESLTTNSSMIRTNSESKLIDNKKVSKSNLKTGRLSLPFIKKKEIEKPNTEKKAKKKKKKNVIKINWVKPAKILGE